MPVLQACPPLLHFRLLTQFHFAGCLAPQRIMGRAAFLCALLRAPVVSGARAAR